jgi:endonuclease-3 related protein
MRIRDNVENYSPMQGYLVEELPQEIEVYIEFHALIVKLGRVYCKKKSLYHHCPLENMCNDVNEGY